jgi:hypothetical protein
MAWEYHKVYIAFASQPDAATPLWTDVTAYVDGEIVITRGRPSELDEVQPSTLTVPLNNADHRFTPGNPYSPYYPNVKPARRIRVTETIDGITYYLFDGYIQFPDIPNWAQAVPPAKFDQIINVSAVDRMGRLDRARSFVSVLADHIRYNGSTGLKAHYPLNEAAAPCYDYSSSAREPATVRTVTSVGGLRDDLITFDDQTRPPAEDVGTVRFHPVIINTGTVNEGLSWRYLQADFASPITVTTGQVLTLVVWTQLDDTLVDDGTTDLLWLGTAGASTNFYIRREDAFTGTGRLGIYGSTPSWGGTTGYGPVAPRSTPLLLAARFRPSSTAANAQELWVNGNRYQFTEGGVADPSVSCASLQIGAHQWAGVASGVQVYVATDGAADDYSWTKHLAQLQVGVAGMVGQRADQRISILAGYAGVASTDLQLDAASATMAAATLAGQKPAAELRVAADADSGLIFTSGDGKIVFHSRQRRYNPAVAATVDLSWLTSPWQQRVQPPVNAARITGGNTATAVTRNNASADEYGEYEAQGTIETATDADARNLALWYTSQFAAPAMRAPMMTFDLTAKTNTVRHTILAREISDRFNVSGLPANAPEGLNSQFVEGITHRISTLRRVVEWNTSPMVGSLPGVPATWAQVGSSVVGSSTVIAY